MAATDPTPRTPIWQPDTHGCWCCHPSAAAHSPAGLGHSSRNAGRRAPRTRQQNGNDLSRPQLRAHVRCQCDGSVAACTGCSSRLRPRQIRCQAAHRILALTHADQPANGHARRRDANSFVIITGHGRRIRFGAAPPINRLGHAAANGARTRMKGKPGDEIDRAANQAVRETLFRFHLVMRINTVCHP